MTTSRNGEKTGSGLALASGHDLKAYREVYARSRRIHIPGFLSPSAAETLHDTLQNVAWSTVLNTESGVYDLTPQVISALPPGKWGELNDALLASAGRRFHYKFETHRVSEAGEPYREPAHALNTLATFLNSPPVLAFFRSVTGHANIARADVQATRYGPGHFLHAHDDLDGVKGRLAAYVLNMTPEWRPEWGGVLHFLDDDGHVAEGYVPRFNAINVFDVGAMHFVSYVAPFAPRSRLSVTGWLRSA